MQRTHYSDDINEHDGVSNHQPYDCLLNRLFRRRSNKTSKLHVTGLCAGNSPVTNLRPTLQQGPKIPFVIFNNNKTKLQGTHPLLSKLLSLNLTHCGLVTPYGDIDTGQHWFRQWLLVWRHQTITWTNVDLSSVKSSEDFKLPGDQWLDRSLIYGMYDYIETKVRTAYTYQWPNIHGDLGLGMDTLFHTKLHWRCGYLFLLGLRLNHVGTKGQ